MSKKRRVCIISSEIVGPHANGGIGTHCFYLSSFLSQLPDQEVTLLYTGKIEQRGESYWRDWFQNHLNVSFVWLPPPENLRAVPLPFRSFFARVARNVYKWLRGRSFDVCYFQEMLGNGFRCFQAKRLGVAFQDTVLTCTVHSSWEWICQAMRTLPRAGIEELRTKFMERYCIEHCDLLISPSEYMLRWLEENHVKAPARKCVLPYLFDPKLRPVGFRPPARKIIFFGRLEVRKGLLLFLEALLRLDAQAEFAHGPVEVIFLGRAGYTPDGGGAQTIENSRARFTTSVRLKAIMDLGHRQALDFLAQHNDALVVCPSLVDNSPYAVIESLQLGLNLIAAQTGGIPELFHGTDRLFAPEPASLGAKIRLGLRNELPPPAKHYELERATKLWRDFSQDLLPSPRESMPVRCPQTVPCVHIFLAAGPREEATSRVVDAVAGQTFKNYSLTIISASREGQKLVSPQIQETCQARGWEIKEAVAAGDLSAEFALFLSAGCYPQPEMLECLVQSLTRSGLEALTCCAEVISEIADAPSFIYEPLGPCLEGGLSTNLFGGGGVLLKTGGDPGKWPAPERLLESAGAWAFLAEISLAGRNWDVLPEILVRWQSAEAGEAVAGLDYRRCIELVESYCRTSPTWLRYLLLNAIALERKASDPASPIGEDRKPISFKIKRETRRILHQFRSLYRST